MMTSTRMRVANAHKEAPLRDARGADTIPAPPPSSGRTPSIHDDDAPPASRLVDSNRRDTVPAPPPTDEDIEAPPSTERTLPDAS